MPSPHPPTTKKPPTLTILSLYIALGWLLDIAQLIVSALQLSRGPVADSDPRDVFLTLPPYAAHLQRLAVGWTSVGVVVHTWLGLRVGRLDRGKGKGKGKGGKERVGWGEGRGRVVMGGWVPWSVVSLGVWGVYLGLQTGEGGVKVWGETPECLEYRPTLSQCDLLWGTWSLGWLYILLHLLLLWLFGLTFRRLGEVTVESGVPSAPETGEVVGVADAPRDKWPPLT